MHPHPLPAHEPQDTQSTGELLGRSLRGGFRLFTAVAGMACVAYALSGIYVVQEGFLAVHTRLGKNLAAAKTIGPGGPYFAFPRPIDEVLKIPTSFQDVVVDDTFWASTSQVFHGGSALSPTTAGSLITGDKNIVLARWSAGFRIRREQAAEFLQNVGTVARARLLVQAMLERSAVRVVAETPIDTFYRSGIDVERGRSYLQESVDAVDAGIEITSFSMKDRAVPRFLEADFKSVNQAENEKAQLIEKARQFRTEILTRAAGETHEELIVLLERHEKARLAGDQGTLGELEAELAAKVTDGGGKAASLLQEAQGYRSQVVQGTRALAERIVALEPSYRENPKLFREGFLAEALDDVFKGKKRSFHVPKGGEKTIYLNFGKGEPLQAAEPKAR